MSESNNRSGPSAASQASKGLSQTPGPSEAQNKRKKRTKRDADVCVKAYWGIYNDQLQRVALFEYSDRPKAERTARELTKSKRGSFFVRAVKETLRRPSEGR